MNDPVLEFRQGQEIFPFRISFRLPLWPTLFVTFFNEQLSYSPGLKRPGHEVVHSSPSSAEVKNEWVYASTPPYVFMAWTGKF